MAKLTLSEPVCGSCHEAHNVPEELHRYDPDIPFYTEDPCGFCGRETRDFICVVIETNHIEF